MKRGKRYQAKGLLHAKRFTMKPRDCDLCGEALPTPRPNPKRTCDGCLSDPARLESMRKEENRRERDRAAAKRAAKAPRAAVIRECQHRQEKDGPICGIKFEAKPRIDKNGANRGVSAEQIYCPKHREPKAVARRRWLNRNVENYKRLQRNYRHRNLEKVRKYQRDAGAAKRARMAEILAGRPADWWEKPIEYRIIGGELTSSGQMGNRELARRLDASRILKCPASYGATWAIALKGPGRAANFVSDIRKWIHRPGKTISPK